MSETDASQGGYPVLLDLVGRLCLVVGGGPVGWRKAQGLLAAGAMVRLVDPAANLNLAAQPGLDVENRPFRTADLDGAFLAIAATGNPDVDAAVTSAARAAGVLVGTAAGSGDFTLPAVLRRGPLTLAVATAGRCPALAVALRDRLASGFGPEWRTVAQIAAALRRRRLTPVEQTAYNSEVVQQLLDDGLPALVAARDTDGIDRLLKARCGSGCSLAALGVPLRKG
jgi:precorrin-2 dehydrogenase/sirohydrochlorin ferrochelatase